MYAAAQVLRPCSARTHARYTHAQHCDAADALRGICCITIGHRADLQAAKPARVLRSCCQSPDALANLDEAAHECTPSSHFRNSISLAKRAVVAYSAPHCKMGTRAVCNVSQEQPTSCMTATNAPAHDLIPACRNVQSTLQSSVCFTGIRPQSALVRAVTSSRTEPAASPSAAARPPRRSRCRTKVVGAHARSPSDGRQ